MDREALHNERFGRVRHILQEAHTEAGWKDILFGMLETQCAVDEEGYHTTWVPYVEAFKELWREPFRCVRSFEQVSSILHVMPWVTLDTSFNWWQRDEAMSVLESAHVHRLSSFRYYGAYPNHLVISHAHDADRETTLALCEAIARATTMTGLRHLQVSACTLSKKGCELLASAHHVEGITHLELRNNLIEAEGAAALASSPLLSKVEHLDLSQNGISDQGLLALGRSPYLGYLCRLNLSSFNAITDRGIEALANSNTIRHLRHLALLGSSLGTPGLEALTTASWSSGLVSLSLARAIDDADAVCALARATHMTSLESLDLRQNLISKQAAIELSQARHLKSLRTLSITPDQVEPEGLEALLASPHLPSKSHTSSHWSGTLTLT